MNHTLKILEPTDPTQYPYQMSRESLLHKGVSTIDSKPKTFDYFIILDNNPEEVPQIKTGNCNLIDNNPDVPELKIGDYNPIIEKTLCPSDHVPIYMEYTFQTKKITIISWNIQYFINDSENKILSILQKLTSGIKNFIILLQEIKGKTMNTNYDNFIRLAEFLLSNEQKREGYEIAGFQGTLYSFESLPELPRKHNIKRCYTLDTCQKINDDSQTEEDKYSSLLLIFSGEGSASENRLLLVNNVHLVSPGTSYKDQSRSIEFNHIFKRNIQLLTKERPKEQSLKFDNYEIIFGGDMNTHNFNKILFSNFKPFNSVALGGKTKKKRNSHQKRIFRRSKNKILIKKKISQKKS